MDAEAAKFFARAIVVLAMMPTAVAEAWVISSAFKAIGRNPKLEDSLFSKVIILVALVETTAIYAFVAFFTLS